MKHKPIIGAYVLETLTSGMYINHFDCIREYVQNAYDSILAGEKIGLLNKNAGIISISVDPQNRTVTIRDNGVGIPSSLAASQLLNIGMSNKSFDQEAGFRGIGRLAGIAFCKHLIFRTTSHSEDVSAIISFDCEGIRSSISPATSSAKKAEELHKVIEKYSYQDLAESKKDDHYFEVILEDILDGGADFLDTSKLEKYLCQVAPVEYDSQKFVFAPKIKEWAHKNNISIPHIKLIIKSPDMERQVFKPYRGHYKTKKQDYDIDIKDIAFYPEVMKDNTPFWMWYSVTDLLGMIGDEKVSGLRFRKNNIAIGGPERVFELFPGNEGRLNYWVMGEIHILDSNVIPNARRDGFETNNALYEIHNLLHPFIKTHCKNCHDASSASQRPTVKILSSANNLITEIEKAVSNGISSKEEKKELISKLDKETKKISTAIEKRKSETDKNKVSDVLDKLRTLRDCVDKEEEFTVKKIKTNLDRKQRKILIDLMEIVNSALSDMTCSKSKSCLEHIKASILEKYQVH